MISKYLKDIGIKEEDLPWNWCPNDDREKEWKKQREKYGFDSRDTWSLDYTIIALIYPRLKMYKEINGLESFCKFNYKGKEFTEEECIDIVLEGFKIRLLKEPQFMTEKEWIKYEDARMLFAMVMPALWW